MHQTNSPTVATRRAPSSRRARSLFLTAICSAAFAALSPNDARADQLAYWDFNTSAAPTSFNSNFAAVPSISGTGGVSTGFGSADSSSDPNTAGSGFNTLNYPAQGTANKTAGVQFNLNTSNFTVSNFTFDWRTSNSASRYMTWRYTLDGTNYVDGGSFTTGGGDTWNNGLSLDLTSISGASNNPTFAIRLLSTFSPVGFTQNGPTQSFGPNAAYRAANFDDRAYAPSSTWRFDAVSLNGTYNAVGFTPANLTWNTNSGAWDTNGTNKPWLNGVTASAFAQAGGHGDNVTFNNPAANSVVTVVAGGVTPNSTTINNSATLTISGGAIGGTGGLTKNGAGRLILASSNTFTSANSPSSITGGVVETRANNPLGGGTVSIGNATWNSTTADHTANNALNLTGPVTFQTNTNLTIGNGLYGSGAIAKLGSATLAVAGQSANTGAINISAGSLRLDSTAAIGGIEVNGVAGPAINITDAALVFNSTGSNVNGLLIRLSNNISLSNGTISRTQLTPALGPNPTNGDSELSSYLGESIVGGIVSVSGSSTIANFDTRTAGSGDPAGGGGSNNAMVVRMPVLVGSGSTLTLYAVNGTLSNVLGVPTGNLGNTAVSLRAPDSFINPNDSLTLQAGATLAMTGAGDKRVGSSNQGKPIVARGTSASETTIKADGRTYLTAHAAEGNVNTIFVVAGSGTGGLRVEGPMNANYSNPIPTSGFFGVNPDVSPETLGDIYTIMAPARYAGIASGGPTAGVDGAPITRGGTLTLAAVDAAGATGTIDNGPATGSSIKLGLDNTAASGAIVYQIDPTVAVTGANFANFGGLVLKKTGANSVTTRLMANTTLNGTSPASTTLQHLGGTLDVNGKSLTVGAATLSGGNITNGAAGSGTLSAATITKTTASNFSVGPRARLSTPSLTVSSGVLTIAADGTSNSTSRVGAVSVPGSSAIDLVDNDLIVRSGTSSATIFGYIQSGYNFQGHDGPGIRSSAAASSGGITMLGMLTDAEYLANAGANVFDGYTVQAGDTLIKYTYYGDVDFNGQVDTTDYNIIDFGFLVGLTGWANGDVDYNNQIDTTDYNLIDFAFLVQSGSLRQALTYLEGGNPDKTGMDSEALQMVIKHQDQFGAQYVNGMFALVPEPTSTATIFLSGVALIRRRRR